MKKTCKILAIILAILMVISIIPITASAATYSGTCGENLTWTYNSSTGTLTIAGTGVMDDYKTNNRPWESYEDNIKVVTVENGVTAIGNYAFYQCEKLTTITLPDSITLIGEYAFYDCSKLKNINIPDSIEVIKSHTFTFCKNLTEITIPNSITEIGESAFYACYGLTEIVIPDSVTTIGDDAFYGCDGLSEIIIPDSVTTIGDYAFGFCDGILNVTFGSGLTTIGKYAFGYCINIKNITIPANVTTIEDGPFYNCESLLNITVDSNNPNYSNDEYGVLFNKDKTTLIQYPIGHTRTSYIIPDGVTTIGNVAFYNCDALTSVTLPNGVKIIEDDAFYDCDGLTEIIIPNSVTKIGGNVLTYITTIIYYGGTANQWKQLLANNPEAEKNYLKDHMVYCVDQTVLPSGTCGDNLIWTYNMLTGVLTISGTGEMYDFEYFVHFDVVDVPWWVYHDDINKIIFENGVTSIGDYAFYGCNNLSEVTMSKNVTEIGDKAFVNCTSLKSCVIPVTVTTLGERAFYNCSGVTDVYYEGTEEQWSNFIVFTPSGAINLYPPFKGATMHYNYHIHRNVLASEQVAPTCTKQGYTTYTCDCGDSYVDYYVDALGHTEETIPAVVPTCTETGLTAGSKCSVCGETLIEQEAVDALGHTPANAVEENYVAPTCTENGSKDIVIYCSVCDDELSRETVVLESTGHADNDCDGYCDMDEELLDPSVECDHICHKDGILGFVWRIINVFNMLFGLNKTCDCGVAHY